jgi:hypothetical protein
MGDCPVCYSYVNEMDERVECDKCKAVYHKEHFIRWTESNTICASCKQELWRELVQLVYSYDPGRQSHTYSRGKLFGDFALRCPYCHLFCVRSTVFPRGLALNHYYCSVRHMFKADPVSLFKDNPVYFILTVLLVLFVLYLRSI